MFPKTGKLLAACALLALLVSLAVPSQAQTNDVYQLTYFDNQPSSTDVSAPDQFVRIINTGQIGSPIDPATKQGTVCADIYVFDDNQEMLECCSCAITANGLLTLSVGYDLTSRTLTSVLPPKGVIKVVSDQGCNERSISAPIPGALRSFGTHLQLLGARTAVALVNTETEFQSAPLTDTERTFLGNACSFVHYLGSGQGVCNCGGEME